MLVVQHAASVGLGTPISVESWYLNELQTADWLSLGGTEALLEIRSLGSGPTQVTGATVESKQAASFVGGETDLAFGFDIQSINPNTAATFAVDEIRIGTTLADAISVAEVPEPGSLCLFLSGILIFASWGERRRGRVSPGGKDGLGS